MKKRLIDKIAEQLKESNPEQIITVDSFSDNSACWIDIRPKQRSLDKGYYYFQVLTFNGKGSKVTDVITYKSTIEIQEDEEQLT
jgi:hypothetical protein